MNPESFYVEVPKRAMLTPARLFGVGYTFRASEREGAGRTEFILVLIIILLIRHHLRAWDLSTFCKRSWAWLRRPCDRVQLVDAWQPLRQLGKETHMVGVIVPHRLLHFLVQVSWGCQAPWQHLTLSMPLRRAWSMGQIDRIRER